jgi:hypothetical protein
MIKRTEKHEVEAQKESSPFMGGSASDARDGCSVPLDRCAGIRPF